MFKKVLNFFVVFSLILPITLFFVSCKNGPTTETKPTQATILMLVGSHIPYWEQIVTGAERYAQKNNAKIVPVFHESDTVKTSIIESVLNLDQYENLKGIIVGAGDSTIDIALAKSAPAPSITVVAVDQKPNDFNPIAPIVVSSVIVDNIKIAKEIASKITEKNVICLSYTMGGSVDRSNAFVSASGKKTHTILATNAANATKALKEFVESHKKDDFAVLFTTGSFVNKETMNLLKGHKVYSTDINQEIYDFVKEGRIEFTVVPNTYEIGTRAAKTVIDPSNALPNQYIPVIFANKDNLASDSVMQFLK